MFKSLFKETKSEVLPYVLLLGIPLLYRSPASAIVQYYSRNKFNVISKIIKFPNEF